VFNLPYFALQCSLPQKNLELSMLNFNLTTSALFPVIDGHSTALRKATLLRLAVASLTIIGLDASYAQSRYLAIPVAVGSGEGINNHGDICGTLSANNHAFLYKWGRLTDLGVFKFPFPQQSYSSRGFSVNDSDAVAGRISSFSRGGTSRRDSFLYVDGEMFDIAPGSNDGGFSSSVGGNNNRGEVVGSYDAGGTITNPPALPGAATARAFLYRNGQLYDVGTLGGLFSVGSGINNAGQIVGNSTVVIGKSEAFAFLFSNGRMQVIGGAKAGNFAPWAINDNGWITGTLTNTPVTIKPSNDINRNPTDGYAALYVNGNLSSLGTLSGYTGSQGLSINNSGTIIGALTTPDSSVTGVSGVFIYSGGRMYDLNKLVFGPWTILSVGHINDAGEIAATGSWAGSTVTYALILIPVPFSGLLR
jgi:chitinase